MSMHIRGHLNNINPVQLNNGNAYAMSQRGRARQPKPSLFDRYLDAFQVWERGPGHSVIRVDSGTQDPGPFGVLAKDGER